MHDCPYCNKKLMYGETRALNYVRSLVGSRKRYCPGCHRKWVGKSRRAAGRSMAVTLCVSVLAGILLCKMSDWCPTFTDSVQGQISSMVYSVALSQFSGSSEGGGAQHAAVAAALKNNPRLLSQLSDNLSLADILKMRNDPAALAKFKQRIKSNPALINTLKQEVKKNPSVIKDIDKKELQTAQKESES